MKKIKEIFKDKKRTLSFELFPPKTEKGYLNLLNTIEELAELKPDFISCTYGAGGGNREKTLEIAELIQKEYGIPSLVHLTCVLNTKAEIKGIVDDIKARSLENILALRGDPPLENPDWEPGENNFRYSKDLCDFIRKEYDNYFSLGVAGFPEGHIKCKGRDLDAQYLKMKIENGAQFVISQVFLDNQDYFEYLERLKKIGISVPVIPGILPVTSYKTLIKFSTLGGAKITDKAKNLFEPIKEDPEAMVKSGIEFAIEQCADLINGGAPGLHFYTLNKSGPTKTILNNLKIRNLY